MIKYIKSDSFEGDTISLDLNTGVLQILNVGTYGVLTELYEGIADSWYDDELEDENIDWDKYEYNWDAIDKLIRDIASPIVESALQDVLPSVTITPTGVWHPKYYNFSNDELEFTLTCSRGDYEKLEQSAMSVPAEFGAYLKSKYKSYDGFISFMADDIYEFEKQDFWKQFVQVVMFELRDDDLGYYQYDYDDSFQEAIWQDPFRYLIEE